MSDKPVQDFTLNFVSAAIWDNSDEKRTKFRVTLTKSYKDGEEWKRTTSLTARDIPSARTVLEQAYVWIGEERRRRAKARLAEATD